MESSDCHRGKSRCIGGFDTVEEASKAYQDVKKMINENSQDAGDHFDNVVASYRSAIRAKAEMERRALRKRGPKPRWREGQRRRWRGGQRPS